MASGDDRHVMLYEQLMDRKKSDGGGKRHRNMIRIAVSGPYLPTAQCNAPGSNLAGSRWSRGFPCCRPVTGRCRRPGFL